MPNFAIYGLGRSGTNVTEAMLRHAFGIRVLDTGKKTSTYWKHGAYNRQSDGHKHMVICVRNVWEWLPSILRLHKCGKTNIQKNMTLRQFIRREYTTYHEPNMKHKNPIIQWNAKIRAWLDADNGNNHKIVIKNEELIRDFEGIVLDVADALGIEPLNKIKRIETEAGPSIFRRKIDGNKFVRGNDILERKCLDQYTDEDKLWVCDNLDWSLVEELKYEEFCQI